MKKRILVTGGMGFIGSHVVDKLLNNGDEIIVFDNLSSGYKKFVEHHINNPNFSFIKGDLLHNKEIEIACKEIDFVYHLSANPDVRLGEIDTKVHFDQNIITTYNLLESMRKNNIKGIAFTSTSTVYGEASIIPTPENYGPLVPISLYGASKLACEALIMAYSHMFNIHSWIFRFANIVGSRGTHGIIKDFILKLKKDPTTLEILGDGMQSKSYLHVNDCVDAILHAVHRSSELVNIFNIGSEDRINATEIGKIVIEELGLTNVKFSYTGGRQGWKGDVPKMLLDIKKIKKLGWSPKYSSFESVKKAACEVLDDFENENNG